ncbi:MAG: DNA cytosine methyltransferase [Thermoplasmataceae archaeon]
MSQEQPRVLDLFSGIGGLSWGFVKSGFAVTGVDISDHVGLAYTKFTGAKFLSRNLGKVLLHGDWKVVIGGPPCKPWSPVNQSKRIQKHRDYGLVERYFMQVKYLVPEIFILENVPAIGSDGGFLDKLKSLENLGYSVSTTKVIYSDYGAAVSRRRLLAIGLRSGSAQKFIEDLKKDTRPSQILTNVIAEFRDLGKSSVPDHVWPNLRTISKYADKYSSGKYGWRILKWDQPSPSFGNVMKTYILPPDSDPLNPKTRVLSVLEVSRIMGFNHGFVFPEGLGVGERYQMLVDSVSPVFSEVLAEHVQKHLKEYRF